MKFENGENFGGIGDMETGHDRTGRESAYASGEAVLSGKDKKVG